MPAARTGKMCSFKLDLATLAALDRVAERHDLRFAGTISRSQAIRWLAARELDRIEKIEKKISKRIDE